MAANVAQGLQLGADLTGIDLTALLAKLSGIASDSGNGGNEPKAVTAAPQAPAD